MEVKLDGIVGFLKLPAYILGALVIASGLLLFSPDSVIQSLYMSDFRNKYGFTIGIVFVVSLSILVVLAAKSIYNAVTYKSRMAKLKANQEKFLMKLSRNKVSLICALLHEPTHTLLLPMHDGIVIELEHYNVITPAGQNHLVSMPDPEIKYFLQPWVEDRINENEELRAKYCM